jgi:hypothetical protein
MQLLVQAGDFAEILARACGVATVSFWCQSWLKRSRTCSRRVWRTPCGPPYDAVEATETMLAVAESCRT